MKLFFFDCNADLIRGYKRHIGDLADCIVQDVEQVVADVLISPANSYGVMDGGIDEVYMAMFPSVQLIVQAAIVEHRMPDRWESGTFQSVRPSLSRSLIDLARRSNLFARRQCAYHKAYAAPHKISTGQ